MQPEGFTLAGRVVGGPEGDRKIVDRAAAIAAYRGATTKTDEVAYITHFSYDESVRDYMRGNGRSMRGFSGATWAERIYFDIDSEDALENAFADLWRLIRHLVDHLLVGTHDLEICFSGGKGFHIGVPTALFNGMPGVTFNETAKAFCLRIAADAEVTIDSALYDRVRLLRAPNSRHAKTKLYKRRLSVEEFHSCGLAEITRLAVAPCPYEMPQPGPPVASLVSLWAEAELAANEQRSRRADQAARRAAEGANVSAAVLDFIAGELPAKGDRHRVVYGLARNLGEAGVPLRAALDLLTPSARDCGLTAEQARRQITCGINDAGSGVAPPQIADHEQEVA
jgi:hypothetical protein